jgi:hypothetical protein
MLKADGKDIVKKSSSRRNRRALLPLLLRLRRRCCGGGGGRRRRAKLPSRRRPPPLPHCRYLLVFNCQLAPTAAGEMVRAAAVLALTRARLPLFASRLPPPVPAAALLSPLQPLLPPPEPQKDN